MMEIDKVRELVGQPEGLKLEFKRQFHQINSKDPQVRKPQRDELIKDILSLANGNVGGSGQTGYLVIGVGDDLRQGSGRELFDVGDLKVNTQQVLDLVNNACEPPLPNISCDTVILDDVKLLVISIPPSPHLHETTRRLGPYSERSVFIRRSEGIRLASSPERDAILTEKKRFLLDPLLSGQIEPLSGTLENAMATLLSKTHEEEAYRKRYLAINELPFEKVDNFTGRAEELDELTSQLDRGGTCHIRSFIFGMGGVGKTSLAIQAVHHIKERNVFPDGIIWYRVRDEELGKVINRISQVIFRALRRENTIAGLSLDEKIETFKREFKDLKILFVLDNADFNVERVLRPLLDLLAPFSLLLTSRQELPLPSSAHIITLGGLHPDESASFFKSVLGEKWENYGTHLDVCQLCETVGFLPLAVKLAAYYVRQNHCSISEYLNLWGQSREKLSLLSAETLDVEISRRNVSACFNLSFQELNSIEREFFLWLGLFQSDFDLRAVLSTLGDDFFSGAMEESERIALARSHLNRLSSLSLVDKLQGFGATMRIHLHPLLTEFAVEKRGGDIDAARQKIYQHYLNALTRDVSILNSDYFHVKNAVNWKFNLATHKQFLDYVNSLSSELWKKAFWKFLGELQHLALNAAQFLGDELQVARLTGEIGDLQLRKGDDHALTLLRQAVDMYEAQIQLPDTEIGRYLFFKYLLVSECETVNEQLLRICEALTIVSRYKTSSVAHFVNSFAGIYRRLGDFEVARELHTLLADYWTSQNEIYNQILSEHHMVECITELEEFLLALENTVNRTLSLASEHQNISALVNIVFPNQIKLMIYKGQLSEATSLLEHLEQYAQITDSETLVQRCHYLRSRVHEASNDYGAALSQIKHANHGDFVYPLHEAYLSFLCDDLEGMSYCLDRAAHNWSGLSAWSRMLFYGVLTLRYVKEINLAKLIVFGSTFLAYKDALVAGTVELDFPQMTRCIENLSISNEQIESKKLELFGKREARKRLNKPVYFTLTPEPRISLPKTFSPRPITVEEMTSACAALKIELPTYYKNFNCHDPSEPARFISGVMSTRIAQYLGSFLPELDDIFDLQKSFTKSEPALHIDKIALSTTDGWAEIIEKLLQWCELNSHDRGLLEGILWTTSLSQDARLRLLTLLKGNGKASLPRALYYRIEGTRLNSEFTKNHPSHLIHQWRNAKSLLVLLGIEQAPPITAAWGVKSLTKELIFGELVLLPFTPGSAPEVVHATSSFADAVLVTSALVDDTLVRSTRVLNSH